jgi:hypothetical protein
MKKLLVVVIILLPLVLSLILPTASSFTTPIGQVEPNADSDDSGINIVYPDWPGYYAFGEMTDPVWQVDPTCDNYKWLDILTLTLVIAAVDNTTGEGMEMVDMYSDGIWKDRQYYYNKDYPFNNSFSFHPRRGKQYITFVAHDRTGGTTQKTIYLEQLVIANHWNPHNLLFLKKHDYLLSYAEYDDGDTWRGGPRFSYTISCPFNYYHIIWTIRADIFCNNGTEHYQERWSGLDPLYPFSLKEKPHSKLSSTFSQEWLYDNIDYGDWSVDLFIDGRLIYEDHVHYEHGE